MGQNQFVSVERSVKPSPNFDTIPEDVALSVVEIIQSWVKEEGTEEQREKTRKARDSTLRAAALTSPRTFETYFTSLLQHVTLDIMHLFSFCQMLERGESHYGALVRSIRFTQSIDYSVKEKAKLLQALGESFSTLPTTAGSDDRFSQGTELAIGRCCRQLINLQSLVVSIPFVFFHQFHCNIDGQLKPCAFWNSSLKRLSIELWVRSSSSFNSNLNARNVTWLLVFCRQIEEAALGFEMSIDDFYYLAEFHETFDGLSSVKKLAIEVRFVYQEEEKRTWWGAPEEENGNYKGGNRKTESLINFLQSTAQLDALEIRVRFSGVREGDHSEVSLDCLSTLSRSFTSLKHLRLIGDVSGFETAPLWFTFSFKALRVLTLDYEPLIIFSEIDLPGSLEILCLPFYSIYESTTSDQYEGDYHEESLLSDLINEEGHNLKEVVVPSTPIANDGGERTVSPQETQLWAQSRRELERANAFKDGNVKLRTVEVGESVGDAGEVFWSTIRWLSPP